MELKDRIDSFVFLGNVIKDFLEKDRREDPLYSGLEDAVIKAGILNPWFTREFVEHSLRAWTVSLRKDSLGKWLEPYNSRLRGSSPDRNVAVIMAGNIPLVGFHDFLFRPDFREPVHGEAFLPMILNFFRHWPGSWFVFNSGWGETDHFYPRPASRVRCCHCYGQQ